MTQWTLRPVATSVGDRSKAQAGSWPLGAHCCSRAGRWGPQTQASLSVLLGWGWTWGGDHTEVTLVLCVTVAGVVTSSVRPNHRVRAQSLCPCTGRGGGHTVHWDYDFVICSVALKGDKGTAVVYEALRHNRSPPAKC